ncbi:MAG: hypothetical protein AAGJ34_05790 [Pseudomonadota bacterium]
MSFVPTLIFAIAGAIALVFTIFFWSRSRATSLFIALWFAAALGLNHIGFFHGEGVWEEGDLMRMPLFSLAMFTPVAIYFWARARVPGFAQMIAEVPAMFLYGSQIYRIAGAVFFLAFAAGLSPAPVALPAAVFDSFIAVTAFPMAFLMTRRPNQRVGLAWNAIGLTDFAWAFSATAASLFGLWAMTPAPSGIGASPSALIALFQVPLAIIIHVELLRRLFAVHGAAIPTNA